MKKRPCTILTVFSFMVSLLLPALLFAAEPVFVTDTVLVTPELPTTADSIHLNLFNFHNCCCSQYYKNGVSGYDGKIYLNYEVDVSSCLVCMCIMAGSWTGFSCGPLRAGSYEVYKAESPYCHPDSICPAYQVLPQLVGEMSVIENDTFTIEKTGYLCMVEPCHYYRVLSQATGETTLVAGVKNPEGGYQDPNTKNLVPWRDLGYPVLGYFGTDSLGGWIQKAQVFSIVKVLEPASINGTEGQYPIGYGSKINICRKGGALVITLAYQATPLKAGLYSLSGCPVRRFSDIRTGSISLDTKGQHDGVYILWVMEHDKSYFKKVIIHR